MSEYAQKHRDAMKAKAKRMGSADPHQRVDASSWTPPEALNTEAKTGLRPVSRQHRKSGGKVMGKEAAKRADKKARKSGGRTSADDYVNRNVKKANAEFGKPHDGGYKNGGHVDAAADKKLVKKMVKPAALKGNYTGGTRPTGGRIARKSGGRAKGKTNINIIIGAGGSKRPEMPPSQMAPVRPPQAVPVPPPAPPPQMPPQAMPGAGAGLPPPPMQRKLGGRVGNRRYRSFNDMDAGSGGGLGRLEKTEIQEKK